MKKPECIGWVWLKDQQRPIVMIEKITKTVYRVTLGNGDKKRIKKDDIIRLEEVQK